MIVIKSVDYVEVDEDHFRIDTLAGRYYMADVRRTNLNEPINRAPITYEDIQGEKFITADGNEVVIGLPKKVQEALQIPVDAIYDLHCRLDSKDHVIYNLRKTISTKEASISFYVRKVKQLKKRFNERRTRPLLAKILNLLN